VRKAGDSTSLAIFALLHHTYSLLSCVSAVIPSQAVSPDAERLAWFAYFSALSSRGPLCHCQSADYDPSIPAASIYANAYSTTLASGLARRGGFTVTKKLWHGLECNLSIDNLTNKHYYETQNFFNSRISPTAPAGSPRTRNTRLPGWGYYWHHLAIWVVERATLWRRSRAGRHNRCSQP
jgi:hypothetical protein